MIPAKTQYKTHNGKLLVIGKVFKTWRNYLKSCKHEVFILTDHNKLRRFMDTKSLSSRQVCWAQKLFRYHFYINYWQGKANIAADALLQYLQQNTKEKTIFQAKKTKILHRLQSSLANVFGFFLNVTFSLHQIFICGTFVLPQLRRFWDFFQSKIAYKSPYNVSIGVIRLRLPDLQSDNNQAIKMQVAELPEGWKDIKKVL